MFNRWSPCGGRPYRLSGLALVVCQSSPMSATFNAKIFVRSGSFWINLPIGAVVFAILLWQLKKTGTPFPGMKLKDRLLALDLAGVFLLLSSMTTFLLALGWGGEKFPWYHPRVWVCLVLACILMASFCFLQWKRGDAAVIPPRILFKQRTIFSSALVSCLISMGAPM